MIELLRERKRVCGDNKNFVFFLSGQDYPLVSNSYINDLILSNSNTLFIDAKPIN
jgi:hypothetical protein